MKQPGLILVVDLFPEVLEALLALLGDLSPEDWKRPTVCAQWSVKDIALHLLGGDVGLLSRKRDGHLFSGAPEKSWEELVALINRLNDTWVQAARRLSPRLLCDLLRFTGMQVCEYFKSLDPYALGDPVDWAGPGPAPVWLDLAREYTERWHHQQQIRDAVGRPGLKEPRFFSPVLDAFVRALPQTYRQVQADEGTTIALTVTGDSGGRWAVRRGKGRWALYAGAPERPQAGVTLDEDVAWRLFTRGLTRAQAAARVTLLGDRVLAEKALGMVSVIA